MFVHSDLRRLVEIVILAVLIVSLESSAIFCGTTGTSDEHQGATTSTKNASEFGVKCNGSTDDTLSLQLAIDTTATAHQLLLLPKGVCLARVIALPSQTNVRGKGKGLTVVREIAGTAEQNKPFLLNEGGRNGNIAIHIEGVDIDGNRAKQRPDVTRSDLVSMTNVTDFRLENGSLIHSIHSALTGYGLHNFVLQNESISDWAPGNTKAVGIAAYNGASSHLTFESNTCDGGESSSTCFNIATNAQNEVDDVAFKNNTIIVGGNKTQPTLGIELFATDLGHTTFKNFVIASNKIKCVGELGNRFGISIGAYMTQGGQISGNDINGCTNKAIEVLGGDTSVTENTIVNSGPIEIDAHNSKDVSVTGNRILVNSDLPTAAIKIIAGDLAGKGQALTDSSIVNNEISFSGTRRPAIWVQVSNPDSTVDHLRISGNRISGKNAAGVAAIQLEADSGTLANTLIESNVIEKFELGLNHGNDIGTVRKDNKFAETVRQKFGGRAGAGLVDHN